MTENVTLQEAVSRHLPVSQVSKELAAQRLHEVIHANIRSAEQQINRALETVPADAKVPAETVKWDIVNGRFVMKIDDNAGHKEDIVLHGHAASQALDIARVAKTSFAQNCLALGEDWAIDTLRNVMNEDWSRLRAKDGRPPAHLVRSLVKDDGKLGMAVLSASFATYDTRPGLLKVAERALKAGYQPYRAMATDLQFSLSFVLPDPKIVGPDAYAIGFTYSNSDWGGKARGLTAFLLRLACMNGMMTEKILRQVHLGERLSRDEDWSERTKRLESDMALSALDDALTAFLLPERQENLLLQLGAASQAEISKDKMESVLKGKVTKDQAKRVVEMVTGADPRIPHTLGSGKFSFMDLAQAVSALSQDVEAAGEVDAGNLRGLTTESVGDRSLGLQRFAGNIMSMAIQNAA